MGGCSNDLNVSLGMESLPVQREWRVAIFDSINSRKMWNYYTSMLGDILFNFARNGNELFRGKRKVSTRNVGYLTQLRNFKSLLKI